MPADPLSARSRKASAWLMDAAFPLWLERGLDHAHGGFHERLNKDGSPENTPKRLRVQARQIYCCAEAGRMGWSGAWREGLESALALMLVKGRGPDGFFIHKFDFSSRPLDTRADLYDQAFALFALAHANDALNQPALMDEAEMLWRLIDNKWRRQSRGFSEGQVEPAGRRRQNPHMHMFEAGMACAALAKSPGARAKILERTAPLHWMLLNFFIVDEHPVVREYFTEDWAPAPGDDGKVWEPGHSFEWTWLLQHWHSMGGHDCSAIATRLRDYALKHGVDPKRNVAIDECWIAGGAVKSASARLWPQTERLKAALALYELTRAEKDKLEAAAAFDGLWQYISDDGFWADRMNPDGSLVPESAPASTFYHILVALSELARVAKL